MNDKFKTLITSLSLTAFISTVSGGTAKLFGYPFWLWFTVAFIAQFLISYISNTFLEYKSAREMRYIMLKEAEMVQKNSVKVICASCKKESDVTVRTNEENKFTCGFCNAKNAVYLIAETALVTDPIYETPTLKSITLDNGN